MLSYNRTLTEFYYLLYYLFPTKQEEEPSTSPMEAQSNISQEGVTVHN